MATKREAITVVRVERHKGQNIFRHGQLKPMFAIPASLARNRTIFVSRPSAMIGGNIAYMVSASARAALVKGRKIEPKWFLVGDILRISIHPSFFRSLVMNARKSVFTRPLKR